jgi:hypothetical protein
MWWVANAGLLAGQLAFVGLAGRDWRRARGVLTHALVVDDTLQLICAEAFALHHLPIWAAWAPVMGSYEIIVNAIRKERDDVS